MRKTFVCFWETGARRARGRENVLRLPIVAAGTVNAVAFWFDLHLDDEESITTGRRSGQDLGYRVRIWIGVAVHAICLTSRSNQLYDCNWSKSRAAYTECSPAVQPIPQTVGVSAAPWGIGLEGLEEEQQPVMQSPPTQPAAEAGMKASPAMGSMTAVEAATEVLSDTTAAHAAEASPTDTGLPAEHIDPGERQLHVPSRSSDLPAKDSKQSQAGHPSIASSSSAPGSAGIDGSAGASSEAPGLSQTVAPAANADGHGMGGQGPRAPMRHYWCQVGSHMLILAFAILSDQSCSRGSHSGVSSLLLHSRWAHADVCLLYRPCSTWSAAWRWRPARS